MYTVPEIKETFLFNQVVSENDLSLKKMFGFYIIAGRTIFTPQPMTTASTTFETNYKGMKFNVTIDGTAKQIFKVKDFESESYEKHLMAANLLNNIIKRTFEDTKYTQIGKQPRFFNVDNGFQLPDAPDDLFAVPGFKASAFRATETSSILIDSLFKFMGQKNCYHTMTEIAV